MAAVSQSIPNLLGGASQQPDPVKIPGQVREAINAYLDPTFGCKKRPPTEFINLLASDIPDDAKWFPIFRDEQEKYIVCIYRTTTTFIRVWDAFTGVERTVNIDAGADDYLNCSSLDSIAQLQLADYTLLANKEREITVNSVQLSDDPAEAIVTINAVGYNTNYAIDLNGTNATTPVQVYSATKLEVTPGSYEQADGGNCSQNSAQDHSVNQGNKTGLQFRIVNQCSAYYDSGSNSYRSRYSTTVILRNGGQGWRVGDTVTVSQAGRSFTVRVAAEKFVWTYASHGSASYTTPSNAQSGTLTVDDITTNLESALNAIANYTADVVGNVIRVRRTDDVDFNIAVRGGVVNNAMTVIKNTAADIAELPAQCFPDFTCKVVNTQDSDSDDYYVKFVPDSEGVPGSGSWEETVAKDIETTINPSTMPHALVREADGTFSVGPLNSSSAFGGWADREVGDDKTNPLPSFVGRGISNMFFFANRLGFLSEDNVIMSQPGDYFNFFIQSAISISDADPIDLTAASTRPAILTNAIGTPKGLLLFSENAQFLMASAEVAFSPSTVKLTEISNFTYRTAADPVSTGLSVMFLTEADTYSKVFEMALDSVDNRPQVAENTRIIPEYIPTDIQFSAVSSNNSFVLFGDNSDTVYTFKFFNQGNERQLAGWTKWTFPAQVRMYGFDNDTSYIVTYDGTNYVLSKMEMIDDPTNSPVNAGFTSFLPRLDFISYSSDLTIVDEGDFAKVYFPDAAYVQGATPVVIITSGDSAATFVRPEIQEDQTGFYVEVPVQSPVPDFILGLQYRMLITLPSFYVTQDSRADRIDNPVIEHLYLDLFQSGRYQVEIEKLGYDVVTYDVDVAQAGLYQANTANIDEVGTKAIPIFCLGKDVITNIYADDPVPAALTSYAWRGHYNKRGVATLR